MFTKYFLITAVSGVMAVILSCTLVDFEAEEYPVTDLLAESFSGPMELNNHLSAAEKAFKDEVHGPESFEVNNGIIYTGLLGGDIVKIVNGKVEHFVRTGPKCSGMWDERSCGRPLGMRFDSAGKNLYVADAFKGLLKIEMNSRKIEVLIPIGTMIDGKPLTVPNGIILDEEEGIIYISDSSTKWPLDKILYDMLERKATGRVVRFHISSGHVDTVIYNLSFANGLEFMTDKKSFLVAETFNYKIYRYWTKGANKGTLEVFASKLPGMPDNIRISKDGGFWVGIVTGVNKSKPGFFQKSGSHPILRKIFVSLAYGFTSFRFLVDNSMFRIESALTICNYLERMQFLYLMLQPHGILIKLDSSGKITTCLHAPSGEPAFISEVLEHNGKLFLGSYRNDFVGVLKDIHYNIEHE